MLLLESAFNSLLTETAQKSQIIDAIDKRNEMKIYYTGDGIITKGWRVIRPFVFGISVMGNPVVRAFQVSGPSDSKELPMWRMFRVDRMDSFLPTGKKFDLSDQNMMQFYNPKGDKNMTAIYKRVEIA